MTIQLKSLNTRHRLMMLKLLEGKTQHQIAQEVGMSDHTISQIVTSPLFKAELDRLTQNARSKLVRTGEEVADIINAQAPHAARRLCELIDEEDPNVRMRAAKEVIEYSDFGVNRADKLNKPPMIVSQQQLVLIEEGLKK